MLKTLVFFTCFLFFTSLSNAQDSITKPESENESEIIVLDEIPIYPGCERKRSNKKLKKCMSDKISKFITKNYNLDVFKSLDLPASDYTVYIIFKLNKEGEIIEAKARGPHPKLEKEAVRVINSLPKMTPGKIKEKPVIIPYSIPVYLSNR